jgi:hypothetical protein
MLFTSAATLVASASEDTSARSTGNESVDVDINEIYYDRGSGIAVTVTLTNLDPNSEYTLDWELCTAQYDRCELYNEWDAMGGPDPVETEGSIDIGSGNMFTTSLFTFTDPGIVSYDSQTGVMSGIYNESYHFEASLSIQEVPLTSNVSDDFILGGEMGSNSYLDENSNVLKNTDVPFSGRFYLDYYNLNILDYDIDCGLYEDGNTIPVDTTSLEDTTSYHSYTTIFGSHSNSMNELTPTATSGTHHIECTLVRNYDSVVMGTIIGNDFEIIDADSTGTENLTFYAIAPLYADRTTTSASTQITIDIDFQNLFPGQTYTIDWELCTAQYDQCELYNEWDAMGGSDPSETEGQITFSASTGSHSESFIFTDPGIVSYDSQTGVMSGIYNESYHFEASLSIQEVPLTSNVSNDFILGGEMGSNSYLNEYLNIFKNRDVEVFGWFYLDYSNLNILDYDVDCGLYEDGNTIPVDTSQLEGIQAYHSSGSFIAQQYLGQYLTPTATSGTHHIECTLIRNYDSVVMGTIIGNDFEIIDAETTGTENLTFSTVAPLYADRTTTSASTQITIDIDFQNIFPGQTYTVGWELCTAQYYECELYNQWDAMGGSDPTETEGQITFYASSSSHSESFTFTDPGILSYDSQTGVMSGIYNESYHFAVSLSIQGIMLNGNVSDDFILGGEMSLIHILTRIQMFSRIQISLFLAGFL